MFEKLNKLIKPITYIFAFILALTWAMFVHFQQYGSVNLLKDVNTKILNDVPVTNNLITSKYVVKKVPSVADVEISGTKFELEKATSGTNFQLYIPNQKLVSGKNTVEIKVQNFTNSLQINVLNKYVAVEVDEVKTKSVPVFAHYINQDRIKGKKIENLKFSNQNIKFKGPQSEISQMLTAEVIIDCSKLSEGENVINPVIIPLDISGNKINSVKTQDKIKVILDLNKE